MKKENMTMIMKSQTGKNGAKAEFEIIKGESEITRVRMNGENITDLLCGNRLIVDKNGVARLILEFWITEIE